MESDANRPQADSIARALADMDASMDFPEEPDFSSFKPEVRESLLPRWLQLSPLWVLGFGAVAALIAAGMFLSQQRKTDKTLELLAASARSGLEVPAIPVAAPLAEKKPTDMVFLQNASQTGQARADRPDAAAQSAKPAVLSLAPKQGSARPTVPSLAPKQRRARADTRPAVARAAKAAPTKSKSIVKKKTPKRQKATVLARRSDTQPKPRRRGDSITERLNAAVAACRARPHAPGDCNLRACDVLGSSDPACR